MGKQFFNHFYKNNYYYFISEKKVPLELEL